MICPICLSTAAAVVATSATSGGGFGAVIWKALRRKRNRKRST